jgi:hypothetical protein
MNCLRTHNQAFSWFLLLCGLFLTGCAGANTARWNDITVSNMHGQPVQPLAQTDERVATVLIFITDDCPIANSYAPQINSLVTDFTPRGVSFFLVQVDPMLTDAEAQKHAADFSFTCPVLMDREHLLVKAANAGVTPEATVISSKSEIAYRGRIDDRYIDFGKKRLAASREDLRVALDELLAGESVTVSRTKAIGCFIPNVCEGEPSRGHNAELLEPTDGNQ